MEKLEKLYEGKAKKLYATDDTNVLWVEYMNQATGAIATMCAKRIETNRITQQRNTIHDSLDLR